LGEYAAEREARRNGPARLLVLGVGEGFKALGRREELLRWNGLDGPGIAEAVLKILEETGLPAALIRQHVV
jgi:transketolase C-terminal domain/subunit